MHRDHVPWSSLTALSIEEKAEASDTIPTKRGNIQLLGSTPLTLNQGFILTRPSSSVSSRSLPSSIQAFCVQGHPEYDSHFVSTVIDIRGPNGTGVMSPEIATDGLERATRRHDGDIVIGSVIWKILAANAREREKKVKAKVDT
jgi:hypothetical protein